MSLLCKSFEFKDARVNATERIITGYAATWDRDSGGDTIQRGAFAETIKTRGPQTGSDGKVHSRIKVGFNHGDVVGIPLVMREDERGLYVEAKIDPTPLGDVILARVESGSLDSMSFQYDVLDSDKSAGGRLLKKVEVYELGPVDYPMNEAALITGAKAGRVLSAANLAKLEAALEALQEVRAAAGTDEEEDDMDKDLEKGLQALLTEVQGTLESKSAKPVAREEKVSPQPGAEQKRHPKTADICARLLACSQTLQPYLYCCYGDSQSDEPPSLEIVDGCVEILEEIIVQLRSLGTPAPAAE